MMNYTSIDNFVEGIFNVRDHIHSEKPDLLLAPIRGAIPIIDLLHLIDPEMSGMEMEFPPASSIIADTNTVLEEYIINMLYEYEDGRVDKESPLKMLCIDEVSSGASARRVQKVISKAKREYFRRVITGIMHNAELTKNEQEEYLQSAQSMAEANVDYKTIGIVDLRYQKAGKPLNNGYKRLTEDGILIPVNVDENIVMDRPELCPIKLQEIPNHRFGACLPVMKEWKYSEEYLNFLDLFARSAGVDPANITLLNPYKVRNSERFLPDKYKKLDAYER